MNKVNTKTHFQRIGKIISDGKKKHGLLDSSLDALDYDFQLTRARHPIFNYVCAFSFIGSLSRAHTFRCTESSLTKEPNYLLGFLKFLTLNPIWASDRDWVHYSKNYRARFNSYDVLVDLQPTESPTF